MPLGRVARRDCPPEQPRSAAIVSPRSDQSRVVPGMPDETGGRARFTQMSRASVAAGANVMDRPPLLLDGEEPKAQRTASLDATVLVVACPGATIPVLCGRLPDPREAGGRGALELSAVGLA